MNSVNIDGRLGKDPEVKTLNGGKTVVNFTLACQRNKDETDWFDCTAWDKTADFISRYFKRGDGINIEGSLRQEKWQNNEGQNRSKVTINVGRAGFPLSRPSAGNGQAQPQRQPAATGGGFPPADDNLGIDDIPF